MGVECDDVIMCDLYLILLVTRPTHLHTDREPKQPANPFEDEDWYERYLDIVDAPRVFKDFEENYYRPNYFHRVKVGDVAPVICIF